MEHINDNIELEQMREQLSVLKGKLDKEMIVNDRMMRKIMRQKVKSIKRYSWTIRTIILLGIPYCTWCFMYLLRMSVWFTLVTDIFMIIALVYTYFMHRGINEKELMEGDLIEVRSKMLRMKHMQANWLKFGIPFIILWLAWFVIENMNVADAQYILIGGGVGGVIGGIIGTMNYRKTRRMATEIIKQIEELNE